MELDNRSRAIIVAVGLIALIVWAATKKEETGGGGGRVPPTLPAQDLPSPAAPSQPFVVAIRASVSGGTRPIVTGTTNLPDGTHLYISLNQPFLPNGKERLAAGLSACGDDCFPLTVGPTRLMDTVVVKNGQFSDGPFTDNGAALRPGTYILDVWFMASVDQPPEVLAIIGPHGENMTGPLVGACCPGTHFGMETLPNFQAEKQRLMDKARTDAPIFGATVYYGRSVVIGPEKKDQAAKNRPR
jgi:hypothetical protein